MESFYWDDNTIPDHYGGYSFSQIKAETSILLTYYAVEIQNLVGGTIHAETLDWILARQSSIDYGFQDVNTFKNGGPSSAKLSYYAVEIILSYESDAFGRNGVMDEELWDLKTSGWLIAAIVLGSLGLLAGIIYGIYKYKTRI